MVIDTKAIHRPKSVLSATLIGLFLFMIAGAFSVGAVTNPDSGSIGLEGTISADPPSTAAVITNPTNGQVFTTTPITVSGTCSGDVTVHIFKNGVFSGATECTNGTFSLQIDLFSGQNDLIARVYDALGQAGPDSNQVTVTFNDARFGGARDRITLTSNFAKRGANPGENLTWPVIITGGNAPYEIVVNWGDGSANDEYSSEVAGEVQLEHVYDRPGSYIIVVTAEDQNEDTAFLQLVGVANGAIVDTSTDTEEAQPIIQTARLPLIIISLIIILLALLSFWLGKKYGFRVIRKNLEQ